ncbi:MAG: DUF433 domain-containing protein [Acidobacteria bacterium]|nr:DUF433 domain-containing protein [Acidobacteriota bacterium]
MNTSVQYRYIESKPGVVGGEPVISGTRVSVRAIVQAWRRGVAPEEMPEHYPNITLAQVFEALSYYSDNQEEINSYIERNRIPPEIVHPLVREL